MKTMIKVNISPMLLCVVVNSCDRAACTTYQKKWCAEISIKKDEADIGGGKRNGAGLCGIIAEVTWLRFGILDAANKTRFSIFHIFQNSVGVEEQVKVRIWNVFRVEESWFDWKDLTMDNGRKQQ